MWLYDNIYTQTQAIAGEIYDEFCARKLYNITGKWSSFATSLRGNRLVSWLALLSVEGAKMAELADRWSLCRVTAVHTPVRPFLQNGHQQAMTLPPCCLRVDHDVKYKSSRVQAVNLSPCLLYLPLTLTLAQPKFLSWRHRHKRNAQMSRFDYNTYAPFPPIYSMLSEASNKVQTRIQSTFRAECSSILFDEWHSFILFTLLARCRCSLGVASGLFKGLTRHHWHV